MFTNASLAVVMIIGSILEGFRFIFFVTGEVKDRLFIASSEDDDPLDYENLEKNDNIC